MNAENWKGINVKGGNVTINNSKFSDSKLGIPKYIPYHGVTNFLGRSHKLALLREKFQQPDARIVAISGMGGVGKTELAIQYTRQYEADYLGGIGWLNARELNLAEQIVQFIQQYTNLEVPQQDKQGQPLSLHT